MTKSRYRTVEFWLSGVTWRSYRYREVRTAYHVSYGSKEDVNDDAQYTSHVFHISTFSDDTAEHIKPYCYDVDYIARPSSSSV